MSDYKVPFVNYGAQYLAHKEEYDEAITRCLTEGKLILQDDVTQFEEALAKKLGMKYCVAVANGTDAIVIALEAKGINKKLITVPGYTFKATMEAVLHSKNSLLIADIGENRLLDTIAYSIPVHIEGSVAKIEDAILEDGAQAIGAEGVGYSGTYTLSFYPAKILGCFGDGGAILTNDEQVYKKAKLLRHHWQTDVNEQYGYNSRLDNVQAAFLNVKLKYLDEILNKRSQIAFQYGTMLVNLPEEAFPVHQEGRVWQDYVIRVSNPKALADFLKENGIQTLGYGMTPPHIALDTGLSLPNTEKLYREMIRLPLNETLTQEQVDYVIEKVNEFYQK